MFERKYPIPNNHPILKFNQVEFSFFWTSIKINNNMGKVKKFIKRKLYGGKLNEVITPSKKGSK